MRKTTLIFYTLVLIVAPTVVNANEQLMDPKERDEDISGAEVAVVVNELDGEIFEYVYTVESPLSNKGEIQSFLIDVSCDMEFDEVEFPWQPGPLFGGDASDGKNVPIVPRLGDAVLVSIMPSNRVSWLVDIAPGGAASDMKIFSNVPPGSREYRLTPVMITEGWDYGPYQDVPPGDDPPTIPWIDDFTVTGMIEGPACPGVSPPPESPRYPGSTFGPAHINELLTYSEPLRNRLRVDEDQSSVTVTIHFDERIDPDTFRVQPAWARRHFDAPRPGGSQTVEVPLRGPRTQLQFEVHPRKSDQPRDEDPYHHSFKDMDVFEIRQGDMKAPPGRERDPQQGGNRND